MAALTPDYPQVETFVVEMTNAYRRENKLGQVRINPKLTAAARKYAALLARTQEFSHTAGGTNAGDRIKATGYEFCSYGENLAMAADSRGFASRPLAASAVTGWINSPGHRANLLAPGVTEIGVGVALVPYQYPKYVTVQLFGQPRSGAVEFQISNTLKSSVSYTFAGKTHKIEPSYAITHTSCAAGPITFELSGGLFSSGAKARVDAADGRNFVLKSDGKGLKVDTEKRRKVE
jgi:hypothetical protein